MAQNDTLLEVPGIEGVTRPELDEKVIEQEYGLTVESTYKFAIAQYREQERNRTILIDYHHRLRFIALSKQAKYGTFKEDGIECGWFDLVGNDAKKTWKAIASISQQEAMLEFIRLLDAVCPTFRTQIEHQRKIEHHNQQQRKSSNGGTTNSENENQCINNYLNQRQKLLQVDHSPIESEEILQQFEQQRRQIQEALNKQTYHQFLAYAQQTHPGETEKQENLIRQLQEQHYQQYMSQVYAQAQAASQAAVAANVNANQPQNSSNNNDPEAGIGATTKSSGMMSGNNGPQPLNGKVKSVDELAEEAAEAADSDVSDEDDPSETPANPKVAPASMWTTKNLAEFKETIKKDGPEGILKIGHGETVTVRVPTHPEGNSLFWEFCTDHYDLGFGVYFEWTVAETNQVTVHVDESGDEYDEEEAESGGGTTATSTTGSGDVEAEAVKKQQDPNKPRIDEIIPTFRRDCHEEVFFGSHVYPGRGVYLLKFDNSYSLWRSKTLYYRVFYSK